MNAFKDARREELARRAEAKVLSVYNLSMADFLQNGQQYFNEADHSRLIHEIEDVRTRISCEFLVHGFDPTAYPHLFVADHCGAIQEFGRGGFWAIGSGQQNALSILFFQGVNMTAPLDLTVYHACEAKFMAESAAGVGEDTVLAIIKQMGLAVCLIVAL